MALLPPLLLLLFAAGAGTLEGGATCVGGTVGAVVLLGVTAWGGVGGVVGPDPLRLGPAGRWLPAALLVALAGSWWASPVPRAGWEGLLLVPAFAVLPALVAGCWSGARRRQVGLRATAIVTSVVAGWALADLLLVRPPRASEPLGHHNLLALWLLAVLPLAMLPLRERGPWRLAGAVAGVLGMAALVSTRSLLGLLALGLVALAAGVGWLRRQRLGATVGLRMSIAVALGLGAVGLAAAVAPRLAAIAGGRDLSSLARATYWSAGWEGFLARPWIGWGPGASAWTVSLFLTPRPGVNPAGEVVGQLHSLPLQLAYELGATGLLIVLAVLLIFVLRRRREIAGAVDPALGRAALSALAASGFALLGNAVLDVTAVPVALAVAAGAGLAAGSRPRERWGTKVTSWVVVAYAALALVALAPLAGARYHWERSRALTGAAAARELAKAVALDPGYPLYRAWWTWVGGTGPAGRRAAAEPALAAAEHAVGLGALWLMAGVYGLEAREPWAGEALERACRLDPLAPLAPFYLLVLDPEDPGAAARGARALLAEPRLLAATFWEGREALRAAAIAEIEAWPGVPPRWRSAFFELAERGSEMPAVDGGSEEPGLLVWGLDESGMEALTLHAFRRRPRTARLAPVRVRSWVEALTLPPASALPETSPQAFAAAGCAPPEARP